MDRASYLLSAYWFSGLLLAVALALGLWLFLAWRRRHALSFPLLLSASAFGLAGAGGLISALVEWGKFLEEPAAWAWWTAGAALAALFAMLLLVLISGRWSAWLGYALGGLALLGLGGLSAEAASRGLAETGKVLIRLEPLQPFWLLLLGLVPVIIYLSFRSLAGLRPVRRWVAIGLRCLLVILLTLALAEVRLRHQNEKVTVLFLVDRSLSIPEDTDTEANPQAPQNRFDRRWQRIKKFINESVEKRGPGHKYDQAGVIVFGRRPRLELPPSDAPRLNFTEVASTIDPNYTDIGAAIKLALASYPEGTGKRIVLISDGNENLGNAVEQAQIAKNNGVQIDVLPLAYRNETEVLVAGVEAPSVTEQSSQLPIRVLIRSHNPRTVEGTLTLNQLTEGQSVPVPPSPIRVRVRPGLNSVPFKKTLAKAQESYTYEAIFHPDRVVDDNGEPIPGATAALVANDRAANNRATTHVIALGQRRVLVVEAKAGDQQFLVDHLRRVGDSKFKVHSITVEALPENKADLAVFLSNYDTVLLANVPASDVQQGDVGGDKMAAVITEDQQEVIRSNTYDQGCGLVMIGGPSGFGAGGWQGTPVEKALPVDCDIKSLKVQGKGGLVLIMHASEMAEGNYWQKEIAKLAIKKLSVMDMLGMLYYDWSGGGHKWHIPFQEVGGKRESMLRQVDKMQPGDMPDVDPALQKAYDALTDPRHELATRHIIFISDGDHWQASQALLGKLKNNKITCTTVCITTHGAAEEQKMNAVARATGGRFYNVKSPKALPAIYIKETRLVSQSFVYEKRFQPRLVFRNGPTDKLPEPLPPLFGYVRTTPKTSALVEMPILAPPVGEQQFPVLAYWHYGLGKSVAFTSDARSQPGRPAWDRDWAGSEMYLKFWEQVVDWSLRAVETGRLTMTTEYQDGKVKIAVDARDKENRPLTDLVLRGGVTTPGKGDNARKPELKFEQKNSGLYEAEFKAEEAGSYFINAQARRTVKAMKDGKEVTEEETDSVRSGVTIPYSPEFADMESNTPLLEKLRAATGGTTYPEDDDAVAEAARSGEVYRTGLPSSKSLQPVWYWLLLLTGILLFCDVAVRRIAVDPREVVGSAQNVWARLRGRAVVAAETPQFMDRLKSRKAQVGESLEKARAARRFEGAEAGPVVAPPGADQATAPPARTPPRRPQPTVGPEKEAEAADAFSRLMRAKKRVWEEREKGQDEK
jgi:uncharacterized membrane protein